MAIDVWYTADGEIALGNGASDRVLPSIAPDRFAVRIEIAVGLTRLILGVDASERELIIRHQPLGFLIACSSTESKASSPILNVRCPAGPVAVFLVFDIMNGDEESELVAVFRDGVS